VKGEAFSANASCTLNFLPSHVLALLDLGNGGTLRELDVYEWCLQPVVQTDIRGWPSSQPMTCESGVWRISADNTFVSRRIMAQRTPA
jgi:hypothetical protein